MISLFSIIFLLLNKNFVDGTIPDNAGLSGLKIVDQLPRHVRGDISPPSFIQQALQQKRQLHDMNDTDHPLDQNMTQEIEGTFFSTDKNLTSQRPSCLVIDETFLKKCFKMLRKTIIDYTEEHNKKLLYSDICGKLEDIFANCSEIIVNDSTNLCSASEVWINMMWKTTSTVLKYFLDACMDWHPLKENIKKIVVSCFESEYRSTLSKRCQEYYEFNIGINRLENKCKFVRERFKCLESLLTSACGFESSKFIYHILSLIFSKEDKFQECIIFPNDPKIHAFRYNKQCKRGFVNKLQWCTSIRLEANGILVFHSEYEMMALGHTEDLWDYCGSFQSFIRCIWPIMNSCPEGLYLFIEYEWGVHEYMRKMNFICRTEVLQTYTDNLNCLRSTVIEYRLEKCKFHLNDLNSSTHGIDALHYFCETGLDEVKSFKSKLLAQNSCYKKEYLARCGSKVEKILDDFIDLDMINHLYRVFKYRANCSQNNYKPDPSVSLNYVTIQNLNTFLIFDEDVDESSPRRPNPTTAIVLLLIATILIGS